jgi:hypothetical protein
MPTAPSRRVWTKIPPGAASFSCTTVDSRFSRRGRRVESKDAEAMERPLEPARTALGLVHVLAAQEGTDYIAQDGDLMLIRCVL